MVQHEEHDEHGRELKSKHDKEFKADDLTHRMSARLEHDEESPKHNKHGKQDQEFKADDFTTRMSKQLVQDSAIVAVVKHDYHEQQQSSSMMSIMSMSMISKQMSMSMNIKHSMMRMSSKQKTLVRCSSWWSMKSMRSMDENLTKSLRRS